MVEDTESKLTVVRRNCSGFQVSAAKWGKHGIKYKDIKVHRKLFVLPSRRRWEELTQTA